MQILSLAISLLINLLNRIFVLYKGYQKKKKKLAKGLTLYKSCKGSPNGPAVNPGIWPIALLA